MNKQPQYQPAPSYLRTLLSRSGYSPEQAAVALGIDPWMMERYLNEPGSKGALQCPYSVQIGLEDL